MDLGGGMGAQEMMSLAIFGGKKKEKKLKRVPVVPTRKPKGLGGAMGAKKMMPLAIIGAANSLTPTIGSKTAWCVCGCVCVCVYTYTYIHTYT